MVNTKYDTSYYDSRGYQRKIFDGNVLYESKAKSVSSPSIGDFFKFNTL